MDETTLPKFHHRSRPKDTKPNSVANPAPRALLICLTHEENY